MLIYPVDFYLKNGVPVIIRLLTSDDKEGLIAGFKKLSPYSQYCRFFSPIGHLSKIQLNYLTEIDNKNHLALCAILNDGEFQTGIGVARYIRFKEKHDTAEIAITIIDEYQNLGLGARLLELLIEAAFGNGIKTFTGDVLEENIPMMEILRKHKCTFEKNEGLVSKVKLPISNINALSSSI